MAFELKDFNHSYTKKGDERGLFNVARSDETLDELRYYAYLNEDGAYVIQQITTSGSLTVKVYKYYATKLANNITTDWANRASLTYSEYNQIF
jgi:hypothetical protein